MSDLHQAIVDYVTHHALSYEEAFEVAKVVAKTLRPVITTEAELWDLPQGSVIRTNGKYGDVLQREGNSWYTPGNEVGDILPKLPATVLW